MAFTSKIYPGERFVDTGRSADAFSADELFPQEFGRGLQLELRGPEGYGKFAKPFPKELDVDPSDYPAMIQEIEERGMRLSEQVLKAGIPHKDQASTNYCWVNAPCHATEIAIWDQGQKFVSLSPASVGAPIKGFRNQGGWGLDALEYAEIYGFVPSEFWPDNAIDRRYYTEQNKFIALNYRPTEWWVIKTERECASYHLRTITKASACGYMWWLHETTRYEPVWIDGTLCWRDRNSWKGFGYNGFFLLRGSRKKFDDCVAPAVATGS